MQMTESIKLTVESMQAYGPLFEHWCIAWSGGKDSTTLLTLIVWLIDSKQIAAPKSLTVFFADTRMELLPLWIAAQKIMEELRERDIDVQVVMAPMEKRFLPYILGRGVPPPNNNTFRWCTRQIKIDPMKAALAGLHASRGKVLMLTGVRQGESAIRDNRISMSCSKDGAECGQGWYQQTMPEALCDTLAPILHWRVCHVWEWLKHWAPLPEYGDWSTAIIADAYGGDEAEEVNARTGCNGCPLTEKDTALETIIKNPSWAFLSPLKRLKPIYRELRLPQNRLRKTGKDSTEMNKQRMGPLTMAARKDAFYRILAIQDEIAANMPEHLRKYPTELLNAEEQAFIMKCWEDNVWPNKWDGNEPTADTIMDTVYPDGTISQDLFGS
jgi:DNA sulfur modification protein DndC